MESNETMPGEEFENDNESLSEVINLAFHWKFKRPVTIYKTLTD